jgi:RNA polymerase sigma-70 factor, ECF subfamily
MTRARPSASILEAHVAVGLALALTRAVLGLGLPDASRAPPGAVATSIGDLPAMIAPPHGAAKPLTALGIRCVPGRDPREDTPWLAGVAAASAIAEEEDGPPSANRAALTRAMDRHAEGDPAAFGQVYDLLGKRLFAFFVRRTRDRAMAEDLVQQTLLQMHCARQSYVRGSDVVPWAFAIGRRLLIDAHRRRKNEVLFDSAEDAGAALDGRASRDEIPDEVASTRQIAARVQASLDALPEAQRTAYVLVREEGLSVAEAAEVMGITATALKLRAHRVYEHLRGVLKSADKADRGRKSRG